MSFADTLDDLEAMNHAPGDGTAPVSAPKKRPAPARGLSALLRKLLPRTRQNTTEGGR